MLALTGACSPSRARARAGVHERISRAADAHRILEQRLLRARLIHAHATHDLLQLRHQLWKSGRRAWRRVCAALRCRGDIGGLRSSTHRAASCTRNAAGRAAGPATATPERWCRRRRGRRAPSTTQHAAERSSTRSAVAARAAGAARPRGQTLKTQCLSTVSSRSNKCPRSIFERT